MAEIKREVIRRGLTASIGETTIWRWLSEDAIRPWHHRSWIFPRDSDFANEAGRVLDLYEGTWQGQALGADDYVISAAEKTSIQARRRKHSTTPPGPAIPMRVEHEYARKGAWVYLAAWDVHRARIFNSLTALEKRLLVFQIHYQAVAKPFQWRFTRRDLEALLLKLASRPKAA